MGAAATRFTIRPAVTGDAEAACTVLRRSITELCAADHDGNRAVLDGWLANKTPRNVRAWIDDPSQEMLVAVCPGGMAGVAAASLGGDILLNYVSPDFRFRGVSKALLGELEHRLRARGRARVTLTSTRTALDFYLAQGYRHDGPPRAWRDAATAQTMVKDLT